MIDRLNAALADRYILERELGAGGMATVYLAHDIKHDRKVAIKVLRPELAAVIGAERFLSEIKTTANLQHPHILPLFDSGEAQSFLFYVMPYVEGESLRDRITREHQLPVGDAVRLASEIASALDYAHRQGVIHRDIKPENVMLHDGRALVADFGIALAMANTAGTRMTETGMSLGTPHYMSPEQAMGEREITGRSDVYALGAITYEMLCGEPPFTGPTAQAIIARVMTEEPRGLSAQRKSIPPGVEAAVFTALEKLPADRYTTAAEFAAALASEATTSRRTVAMGHAAASPASRRLTMGALALAVAGSAFGFWGIFGHREVAPPESVAFTVTGRGMTAPDFSAFVRPSVALSPDGRVLVYPGARAGRRALIVRELDSLHARVLEGTDGAADPIFSPDGREILFRRGTMLYRVALRGTPPVQIADIGQSTALYGMAWLPDGMIHYLIEASMSISRVPADGSTPPVLTPLPDSLGLVSELTLVPGTEWLLSTRVVVGGMGEVVAISSRTGEVRWTNTTGTAARVSADGRHILLGKPNGVVTIARFDSKTLQVIGREVTAAQGVQGTIIGQPSFAVSPSGTIAFTTGSEGERTVVEVTREGRERVLLPERAEYKDPRWSPDETRFAVERVDGTIGDLWIYDTKSGTNTRLTNGSENLYPLWSRDGRRLIYTSRRSGLAGLWTQPVDGSGEATPLQAGSDEVLRFPHALTPDGTTLLYRTNAAATGMDIGAMALDGTSPPRDVLVTSDNEGSPTISPDGRWMAYISDASGTTEVYITPWPNVGRRAQISAGGGTEPQWNPRGGELFYRTGDALVSATLTERDGLLSPTRRDTLFAGNYFAQPRWPEYDVSADGQRFLMIKRGEAREELVVITNWLQRAIAQLEKEQRP